MRALSPGQFDKYRVETATDESGNKSHLYSIVASNRVPDTEKGSRLETPVASMEITLDQRPQNEQAEINRGSFVVPTSRGTSHHEGPTHRVVDEIGDRKGRRGPLTNEEQYAPRQQRWGGGNFERRNNKVSWVGASTKDAGLLKGMMGTAREDLRHEGTVTADSELSQYGARLSRGMNRKYGLPPHPSNPDMHSTFTINDEYAHTSAMDRAKSLRNSMREGPMFGWEGYAEHGSAELASAGNQLESRRILPPAKGIKPGKGQGQLF